MLLENHLAYNYFIATKIVTTTLTKDILMKKSAKSKKQAALGLTFIALSAISFTNYSWAGNKDVQVKQINARTFSISASGLSANNLEKALIDIGVKNYSIKTLGADEFQIEGVDSEIMGRLKVNQVIFK